MKHLRKLMALVIAMVMMVALSATAFAQEKALNPADPDGASITIMNPAKGETYTLFKLFDATVSSDGKIAYQGTIPESLAAYFENINAADGTSNYVKLKDGADEAALMTALETWASSATATVSEVSNGDVTLKFTGLPYGYYVITTTHEDTQTGKAAITVDSTIPDVEVYDKNETVVVNEGKTVDGESFSIGDTITFTAKFLTTNYYGKGENAGKVYKYVINDTLPDYLSDVAITEITIDGSKWADAPTGFTNKEISIPWVDEDGNSLYKNGAEIVVTYTAKLTSLVNVGAANTNTIGITPYDEDDKPYTDPYEAEAEVTTYAAALKKTDGSKALAGAKFKFYGLIVEETAEGVYTVVSYDSESKDLGTEVTTDANGKLYIVGLAEDVTLKGVETAAPDGYNKLEEEVVVPAQVLEVEIYKESGTRYYDAKGNLVKTESESITSKTVEKNLDELDEAAVEVINKAGTELPSTGGTGTVIFTVLGAILVLGAGLLLVARRRMNVR